MEMHFNYVRGDDILYNNALVLNSNITIFFISQSPICFIYRFCSGTITRSLHLPLSYFISTTIHYFEIVILLSTYFYTRRNLIYNTHMQKNEIQSKMDPFRDKNYILSLISIKKKLLLIRMLFLILLTGNNIYSQQKPSNNNIRHILLFCSLKVVILIRHESLNDILYSIIYNE